MPNDPSSQPTQPLTDEGPASDRDKGDMIAARREIQAVLDGRLPMDNAAYSAAIVMVLWKAGWRPRHLSTSMDRCDIADGWWRLGRGWRKRFEDAQAEVDRLRHENEHHQRYRYAAEHNAHDAAKEAWELREELDALLPIASPHRTTKADRERNWLHGSWESFAARAKPARAAANRWTREADRLERWAAKRKAEAEAGEWPPCQGCDEHPALDQDGRGQTNGAA